MKKTPKAVKRTVILKPWGEGWAVPNHDGLILSHGIGNGIYSVYSKKPSYSKGLVRVLICFYPELTPLKKKVKVGR